MNIDTYIAGFPAEIAARLAEIREIIRETAPEAVEGISYAMPSFKYRKKILLFFGGFKNHIGFYALPSGRDAFIEKLTAYKTSKGSIRFAHNQPIPFDLVREIVVYRMLEIDTELENKRRNRF